MKTTVRLLVDKDRGVIGLYEDDCFIEDDGEIYVDVELNIPDALFEPLRITVEVPEGFVPGPVKGSAQSVEIPVKLYEVTKVEGEVQSELQPAGKGILALLKRAFVGN